jgi:hypothetical protein
MQEDRRNEHLSRTVRQFIVEKVNSVDLLETLLLLHAQPERCWTAEEVGRELRTSPGGGQNGLAQLNARGLAKQTPKGFHFMASNPDVSDTVNRLAEAYRDCRVAVITQIYSKPANSIQAFADAFRLKKPKSEEAP